MHQETTHHDTGTRTRHAPEPTQPQTEPVFDPALFTDAEYPDDAAAPDEIAAVEAELDAVAAHTWRTKANSEPDSDQQPQSDSAETSGQDKTGPAVKNSRPGQRSPQDVERMRAARAKARQEALRRGPGATGRPFQDPRLAAQDATSGPPPWLGTRWRQMPPEQQREAWVGLRRWVDWFIHEYQLNE